MKAHAKVNLALVVGPLRPDGKHEVLTVLQRLELHDVVELEPAEELVVEGFSSDTLVRAALAALADATGTAPGWRVRIEKRIPVAAGLGGGSSDAAAALVLANERLGRPFGPDELHRVAATVGSDVPFFLREGPQLGSADGSELVPLELPDDYVVLLAFEEGATKASTADVYRSFDERGGEAGFEERREVLSRALPGVETPHELARLPRNDLASSPLTAELEQLGAFRADVSGAGPIVYALFDTVHGAQRAADALGERARTWVVRPIGRETRDIV
jgi:4-diphosphocytidyl-2-C-methyl-D-erythritol kinase